MGRRPAGQGPRRPAGAPGAEGAASSTGLVAYHSDSDHEEKEEEKEREKEAKEGQAQDGQAQGEEDTASASPAKAGEQQEAGEEETLRAAAEAEDLFKSLEEEMQQKEPTPAAPPPAPRRPRIVTPLPAFTEAELKRLTSNGKDAKLHALLVQCVDKMNAHVLVDEEAEAPRAPSDEALEQHKWETEFIKLLARLEDWRAELLPSSSLVRRIKELTKLLDEEEERIHQAKEEQDALATAAAAAAAAAAAPTATTTTAPDSASSAAAAEAATTPDTASSAWTAVFDTTYQAYYWHNASTGETRWDNPHETEETAAAAPAPAAVVAVGGTMLVTTACSLILFNGERPLVHTPQQISTLFDGAGARQVRELGSGYFVLSFPSEAATVAALKRAAVLEGDAKKVKEEEMVAQARLSWVPGARATFIRYVMDADEPTKLCKVPVAVTEEDDEEEGEVTSTTEEKEKAGEEPEARATTPTSAAAGAAAAAAEAEPEILPTPPLASSPSTVVVGSVVAKAPAVVTTPRKRKGTGEEEIGAVAAAESRGETGEEDKEVVVEESPKGRERKKKKKAKG